MRLSRGGLLFVALFDVAAVDARLLRALRHGGRLCQTRRRLERH